jgi:RNA polymerase sigma factor (sigma-70 family)
VKTEANPRPLARSRPTPDETFAAAVDLATRGSGKFKRFARRYSLCTADAEDAYQRSLEILLKKAPTSDRRELGAWLHTVIKHEALAVRRQRERSLVGAAEPAERSADTAPALDEQASGRERVRQTAEALTHLKPSEMQCLVLKAMGYSYDEIAERTGFSWTKVNRSLTEGRRSFLERFGELSAGERCEGFQALLSTACDGEASEGETRALRAHLDGCGNCRAALRSYRTAPRRIAELFPPGLVAGLSQQQGWWARLGDWVSAGTGDRAGALAWKLQQGAEAISVPKAAAVVASTAALAGGTAVHEHRVLDTPSKHRSSRTE